jgi:glycosyltransferase involved in cell wall biosynthesis
LTSSGHRAPRVILACDFFVRYSAQLAAGLADRGAEVALVTRDHDLEFGGHAGGAESFVRDAIGSRNVRYERLGGRVRSPQGLREALRLRRRLRKFGADYVHVQGSITNDPRLLLVAGTRPRRFALTNHNPSPHPGETVSRANQWANETLARMAGLIFVHGEALREELRTKVSPRAPIVVVPHGVEPGAAAPAAELPSILFFGRITRYKGLDVLLDAMPEVWRRVPEARLTIAGSGDVPEHAALGDPRVTVEAGYVADERVPSLFGQASCVVLPYRKASQSGVGSLAKQHGRPLVVTDVGALPELVADGSGLIAPAEDPAGLAAALNEVLSDRELARALGEAGIRGASEASSWGEVAGLTLRAYDECLGPIR